MTGGVIGTLLELLDDFMARLCRNSWFRQGPLALLLAGPALGVLAVFGVWPLIMAVYLSLFRGRWPNLQFVRFENYTDALSNADFWKSLSVTLYYAAGVIPVSMALSFVVAGLLYRIGRGRGFFRTVYFLPYVTSAVAAAMVWRVIFHDRFGVINLFLGTLGLPEGSWPGWFMESRGVLHLLTQGVVSEGVGPSLALCCVVLFDIWHSSGFMVVVFLAAFTAIPPELEEAATIDGAGWWTRTRHIVMPLMSPTIFFLLIVNGIKSFQAFNSFFALTGNGRGPLDSTQNLTIYIFTNLYSYQRVGYGASVAVLLALAIVALTLIQWRIAGRRVHYE